MEKMKSVPISEIRGQNPSPKNNLCEDCKYESPEDKALESAPHDALFNPMGISEQ
jgi:hypothetical protein